MKDGSVVFNPIFLNPDIVRPVGPIDPEIGVVMFCDASSNKPIMGFLSFALHLDIVIEYGAVCQETGPCSRKSVSADYPYWIETSLRKDSGNNFNSIFFTGCCGNINHWDFSKPRPQCGHKTQSIQIGDSLYFSIKRALPGAEEEIPFLATASRLLYLPLHSFTADDLAWAKGLKGYSLSSKSEDPSEWQQFLNNVRRERILWLEKQKQRGIVTAPVEVQVFCLNNNSAIVTIPGEMFVGFELMIKKSSPLENTIVVELADNPLAYVLDKKAFSQGDYEVENSLLIPGAGETLAELAIKMLKELKETK